MALSYFTWGKFEEAEAAGRKAIELDPDNFVAQWTLGRIHFTNGQMEQALALFQRVIELKPKFFTAHNDLAMTYEALNRLDEARATRDKLLELLPIYLLQNPDDAQSRLVYAVSLAEAGRKDEALREGATALDLNPEDARMLYNGACLYARLGEGKRALELLNQAVARGFSDTGWMLQDSDLASLRGDPQFMALAQPS
jgi:adenylate cyclase